VNTGETKIVYVHIVCVWTFRIYFEILSTLDFIVENASELIISHGNKWCKRYKNSLRFDRKRLILKESGNLEDFGPNTCTRIYYYFKQRDIHRNLVIIQIFLWYFILPPVRVCFLYFLLRFYWMGRNKTCFVFHSFYYWIKVSSRFTVCNLVSRLRYVLVHCYSIVWLSALLLLSALEIYYLRRQNL
jgi:hypothetical protein